MEVLTQERKSANLDYLSWGNLSAIGILTLSALILAGHTSIRALRNTKTAQKVLPSVQSLKATGVRIYPNNQRDVYVLLDKNGDDHPDFAAKPKESIDFNQMNGQPGSQWMNKLSLATFHELKRAQKE